MVKMDGVVGAGGEDGMRCWVFQGEVGTWRDGVGWFGKDYGALGLEGEWFLPR